MIATDFIGKVATFFLQPDSVEGCLAKPCSRILVGQIIAAKAAPAIHGIPDFTITVRGKTGKTLTVSMYHHYLRTHDTWREANEHAVSQP